MFRNNYPDAPRPHDNHVHRRQSPSVKDHFKSAWLTAIIGCVMFSTGMWLLFWNEGRAVKTSRSLEEAMGMVIPLHSNSIALKENNGHLVHISGVLEIGEPLTEPEYGVSIAAVKLKRRVQMYQWVEAEYKTEAQDSDPQHAEVNYSYATEWRDKLVDSSSFYIQTGHHNPKDFPMKTTIYMSEHVTVSGFILGQALKEKFYEFVVVTSDERPERRDIKLHSGLYYHSQDVWNPEVGDIRVQFSYAGKFGDIVSIVAMQVDNTLEPYLSSSGHETLLLRYGPCLVEDMFLVEHAQNWRLTWLLRAVGWLMLFLGANCTTTILRLVVSRYSLLYDIVVLGIGNINMAISISVSLLVIAFAWMWYRPILGFCLFGAATLPFVCSAIRIYRIDSEENRYRRL